MSTVKDSKQALLQKALAFHAENKDTHMSYWLSIPYCNEPVSMSYRNAIERMDKWELLKPYIPFRHENEWSDFADANGL